MKSDFIETTSQFDELSVLMAPMRWLQRKKFEISCECRSLQIHLLRWEDHYVNVSMEIALCWSYRGIVERCWCSTTLLEKVGLSPLVQSDVRYACVEEESLSNYWQWTVQTEQLYYLKQTTRMGLIDITTTITRSSPLSTYNYPPPTLTIS